MAKDPIKHAETNRRWDQAHPGNAAERKRKFNENNPGREAELKRKWNEGHPEVKAQKSKRSRTPKGRYGLLVSKSRIRGLEIDISQEQHEALIALPCHWCGGGLNETGIGLDRLDSNRGYVVGNVVPCCGDCNTAKNALTAAGFLELVRRIYERHCAR